MEGGLGYADLVCSTLLDPNLNKNSELYRYNITQMSAIPAATAAVGKVAGNLDIPRPHLNINLRKLIWFGVCLHVFKDPKSSNNAGNLFHHCL